MQRQWKTTTFVLSDDVAECTLVHLGAFADALIRPPAGYDGDLITWHTGVDSDAIADLDPIKDEEGNAVTTALADLAADQWTRLPLALFPCGKLIGICDTAGASPFTFEIMMKS